MSATAAAHVQTFSVGRWVCTVTVQMPGPTSVSHMVVEWWPDVPAGLNRSEWRQYRKGRDKALAELGRRIDRNVAVAEV